MCKGSHERAYCQSIALEVLGGKAEALAPSVGPSASELLICSHEPSSLHCRRRWLFILETRVLAGPSQLQHVQPGGSEYKEVHLKQCLLSSLTASRVFTEGPLHKNLTLTRWQACFRCSHRQHRTHKHIQLYWGLNGEKQRWLQ